MGCLGFHIQVKLILDMINGLHAVIWADATELQENANVTMDFSGQRVNIVSLKKRILE